MIIVILMDIYPQVKKFKKRFYPDSPDWLPKKFEKEYEKFLNYFNHNINLLRFFFDEINEIKYQNYNNQNGNFFLQS